MRRAILLVLLFSLACGGASLETRERWYLEYLVEMDDAAALAPDDATRLQVLSEKAAFEARYALLPTDEATRPEELSSLYYEINNAADAYKEKFTAAANAVASGELEKFKAGFWGNWQGSGVTLVLQNDHCSYSKATGASSSNIDAPIQSFSKTEFVVGFMGINTTFKIDEPPHQNDAGDWQMTVDGVLLTRVSP